MKWSNNDGSITYIDDDGCIISEDDYYDFSFAGGAIAIRKAQNKRITEMARDLYENARFTYDVNRQIAFQRAASILSAMLRGDIK